MQTHSAMCLSGPVSAHRAWWLQPMDFQEEEISGTLPGQSTHDDPLFRAHLVARIRQEIAAGNYDTEDKMELALDRLLRRLEEED